MATHTVLILGAGLMAPPVAQYLLEHNTKVIVASRTESKVDDFPLPDDLRKNISSLEADVETDEGMQIIEKAMESVDAVISMLPYLFHVKAAKVAIKLNKHFLTTSYVSPAMRELHQEALDKGLLLLNECGVDPGTDHMSAMRVMDKVVANGGKIKSFSSICGGLPAPADNNNPFGYKFSWAPRGVLLAARNPAKLLKDGKEVVYPAGTLYDNYAIDTVTELGTDFEWVANRDSLPYIDTYKFHGIQSIVRGTYRNKGWCDALRKMMLLGLLDLEEKDLAGKTAADAVTTLIEAKEEGKKALASGKSLREAAAAAVGVEATSTIMDQIEWIGIFEKTPIPESVNTILDLVCHLMLSKKEMTFQEGEKDMILMRHRYFVEYPAKDGNPAYSEDITTTLIHYGDEKMSAMARTVGTPVAIATRMLLEGTLTARGVVIPIIPELYNPILDELETLGVKFIDEFKRCE